MSTDLFLPQDQFWVLVIGALVPLMTYLQNHIDWFKHRPEAFKATVLAAVAGLASGLYSVIANDVTGFSNIAQMCFSGIVAAFFAHGILWKPANVNVALGARPSPSQTPHTPPVAANEPSRSDEGLSARRHTVPGVGPETARIA